MKPRFVAIRHDGLGSRLQCLHGAVTIARHFDCEFEFAWPLNPKVADSEHHAFEEAENIFAPSFLENHRREGWNHFFHGNWYGHVRWKNYHHHMLRPIHIERIRKGVAIQKPCLIAAFQDYEDLLKPDFRLEEYADAFRAIAFSDRVNVAIEAAERIPLPAEATAIHLRTGDVVHGSCRGTDTFTGLVLSFPLACTVAERERAEGRDILVFGQDPAAIAEVCRRTGGRSAEDLLQQYEFDEIQAWFFETRLMSRCARIVAGNSAFARFAARIGAKRVTNGHALFDGPGALETVMAFNEAETGIDDIQMGFANWAVVSRHFNSLSLEQRLACTERAAALDPGNVLFSMARILYKTEAGETDEALERLEALIGEHAGREGPNTLPLLLWTWGEGFVPKAFESSRKAFFELAWSGVPAAALCQTFIAANVDRARQFGEAYLASAHPSKPAYGDLVQRHLDRI